jgi:hypothetical protein
LAREGAIDSRSFAKIFFSMTIGKPASLAETISFATPDVAARSARLEPRLTNT